MVAGRAVAGRCWGRLEIRRADNLRRREEARAIMSDAAPPPPADAEGPGERFGDYVLLDRIAQGGMAELFLAKRRGVEGFEKIVAIKRILPELSWNREFVSMFINEA